MPTLAVFALVPVVLASIVDKFNEKGLLHEEIGKTKLMLNSEACWPQRFDMNRYIHNMAANETSDVYAQMLMTSLRNTFAAVCRSFNISHGFPTSSDDALGVEKAPVYFEKLRLSWKVQKFENDLREFFLYNRIPSAFIDLIEKKSLVHGEDVSDFSAKGAAFPKQCDHEWGAVDALLCPKFDELAQDGVLYAIAHVGQFMAEGQVYVFNEVPEYVVVKANESVTPVEINSCKLMNGSTFVCIHGAVTNCDISTMIACDIIAQRTSSTFTLIRKFGAGKIVATNLTEVNLTGTTVKVAFPIFVHHTSYDIETDDDKPSLVPYSKITPIKIKASFPGLSHSATNAVLSTKESIHLYHVTRKGVPTLNNQPGKGSVWEDVRDFFLHFI